MCNSKQSTLVLYCFYRKRHNLFDVTLTDIFRISQYLDNEDFPGRDQKKKNTDNAQLWTWGLINETKGDIDVDTLEGIETSGTYLVVYVKW